MCNAGRHKGAPVSATRAALEVIDRLGAAHGPLMFIQSGGCCEGSSPICLEEGELPLGPDDMRLGEIGGAPFYIDAQTYERLGKPPDRDARLARRRGRFLARSRRRVGYLADRARNREDEVGIALTRKAPA